MKMKHLFGVISIMIFGLLIASSQKVLAQERIQEEAPNKIVHPVPRVPIVVDGVKMSPEEITKFNGQDLYYIVDSQAKEEGVVYIYTTLNAINKHYDLATSKESSILDAFSCLTPSSAWKNKWHSGGQLYIGPGQQRQFGYGTYASYNNNIESTHVSNCSNYLKLYDYTNFSGSQLWLATNGWTGDLGIYGWGNRAGSATADIK